MRKSTYTESPIVQTLEQVEGARAISDVCRELGVSNGTHYIWKSKYGGMQAAASRLPLREGVRAHSLIGIRERRG